MFRPIRLGKDEPTVDLIVFLLDADGDQKGPFFFLQVKATSTGPRPDGTYEICFSALDVRRAQAMKVPFFLCVVDRSIPAKRRIYIKGVDSMRKRGIYRLAPRDDLTSAAVKKALHDEVTRIWAVRCVPCFQKLI